MTPLLQRRRPADELLTRDYERIKPEVVGAVRGKLAARGVQLSTDDLEEAYNQAWHALYTKLAAGEQVESREGLLVTITYRRALNEHRAQHPARRAGSKQLAELAGDFEIEARIDDNDRLRQFRHGLRRRLGGRDRQAAALCYLYEYTRPEAAETLGVTPKRMEKIMDGVSKQVGELVGEIKAGSGCSGYASLIRAYSAGLLDPDGDRYPIARDHLDDCSACRRQVLVWRGLAGIAPPAPPLLAALTGPASAATGAAGEGALRSERARRLPRRRIDPKATLLAGAAGLVAAAIAAVVIGAGGGGDSPGTGVSGGAASVTARSSAGPADNESGRSRGGTARATRAASNANRPAAEHPAPEPAQSAEQRAPERTAPTPPAPVATPEPEPPPVEAHPAQSAPAVPTEPVHDGAEEFELR